jgi:SAM-dependent methyltransferase
MSGFSPEWLALREPVDHRSRNAELGRKLSEHFRTAGHVSIVDLGCGTGSNLRATAPLLPAEQYWTLADWDPNLLQAASAALQGWADRARQAGDTLLMEKDGKKIVVTLRRVDLAHDLDQVLQGNVDLVTASALFDLVSGDFIARAAPMVAGCRAAFYTVLTYNGVQTWTPEHPADAELLEAFHLHQRSDKGFGPAAGPKAPTMLDGAFRASGHTVSEGDSPWVLGLEEQRLIGDLAAGFAAAARETGRVNPATIADWLEIRRTGAVVGHTDTLALRGKA